jgi:hypothetical protein
MLRLWNRIQTALAEGVAAENPPESEGGAFEDTVAIKSDLRVFGTSGLIFAVAEAETVKQGRERPAVDREKTAEQPAHDRALEIER